VNGTALLFLLILVEKSRGLGVNAAPPPLNCGVVVLT
jgi:hypothetical protein